MVIEGSEGDERESDRARETVRELSSATLQETASRACINILELLLRDVNDRDNFILSDIKCRMWPEKDTYRDKKKNTTKNTQKYYTLCAIESCFSCPVAAASAQKKLSDTSYKIHL